VRYDIYVIRWLKVNPLDYYMSGTQRDSWCEQTTFFERTEQLYLKTFLLFKDNSSATHPEIFSPHARHA
jgi:hypothetical protein